jgi:hypothetical protein
MVAGKEALEMTKITVFIQAEGIDELVEAELADNSFESLRKGLAKAGMKIEHDAVLFLDEEDEPLDDKGTGIIAHLKPGARIHVSRCRKIAVTVNYLHRTAEHKFAPGARLKRVKKWAVDEFKLEGPDAAEHVLQICGGAERPASDTPLQRLTDGRTCAVCFDLVPEKRVEG